MTPIEELNKLKWVESVTQLKLGYQITTKPNVLKLEITRFMDEYECATESMPQPILVKLPSYALYLRKNVFSLRLATEPNYNPKSLRRWIHQAQTFGSGDKSWKRYLIPCLGLFDEIYQRNDSWVTKALIAAEFLQSAVPDMGGVARRTRFAFSLGLVGEEVIKKRKITKKTT